MGSEKTGMKEPMVSIIMPAFNCEDYIGETIESVIKQSYHNWELLIIDDFSTDKTGQIVMIYSKEDPRIKYTKLEKNFGAAVARNKAVELAHGEYLAFLDSDDLWHEDKLLKQIGFMKDNDYLFTCTKYSKIDDSGKYLNRIVDVREKSTYNDILKKNPGNSTVVYNADVIGKITIPEIRKRNDYVMWLSVIKKAGMLYGLDEVLASHRIRAGSLSKNKFSLVKFHWKVYRDIENLSFFKSLYLVIYWITISILKLR